MSEDESTRFRYFSIPHRCKQLIERDPYNVIQIESSNGPDGNSATLGQIVPPGEKYIFSIDFCPFCGEKPQPLKFSKDTGELIT